MGWENVPPNTCSIDEPILPAVELVDQAGRVLNVIVASMCDAQWLAHAYAELGMYEGATAITCRSRADAPVSVPEGEGGDPGEEGGEPPATYPPIKDAPPAPPPEPEPEPAADLEPREGQ